jgi:tetratricopeptide (TPR) repeat protein
MSRRGCFPLSLALSLSLSLSLPIHGDEAQQHEHRHDGSEKLGTVDFPVSCNPAAQQGFGRAVALIHSFWYDEAEKAFTEVAGLDPSCAMAYWGIAMSNFHPIWAPPTPPELERGRAAVAKGKSLPIPTERERDYIAAIEAFYKDAETVPYGVRKANFEKAMEQVYLKNPKDREAAIFYALALLGTAPPTDKTYAQQRKAGDILNKVLPGAEDHPGVAHYLIHSFDYPQLAEIGLPAARVYSKIAAASPHALHMPSHIFTRLALWDDSIESNLASRAAALRHVEKTKPGYSSFDQLHALDYLVYAYLKEGRDKDAAQVLSEVAAVDKLDLPNFAAAYALAAVRARYVLERRQWAAAAALTVRPSSFPWDKYPYAEALTHFARALGGARGGDAAAASRGLARLTEIHKALLDAKDAYWAGQVEVQKVAAEAWIAHTEGKDDDARRLMRAAADLEDSTDKHPVTPGSVLPSRELLGDLLFELGEATPALKEYERSLATAPGRFNSLSGALRAAERAGDKQKAAELFAKIESLCARADGSRAELAALRATYAKKRAERS